MPVELSLTFPDPHHVQVSLSGAGQVPPPPQQQFVSPLDPQTRQDLAWYLETYPVHYTTEVDDERAARIEEKLKHWGGALFNAVFSNRAANRLYDKFRGTRQAGRMLLVNSLHPRILAEPWELLCEPGRTFLFLETPGISIRRSLPGDGDEAYQPEPKDKLHLLFVVARPDDEGLIDPRADPMAVMDALDAEAPGLVSVKFLRPPTLSALVRRLNDHRKPAVDILHFDGHGAYDQGGRLGQRARQAMAVGGSGHLLRATAAQGHHGYLLFESPAYKSDPVPAWKFGDLLQSKRVALVILSACQSAMVSGEDALGSIAPRLIRAGIPSVLAMTQSVLVATTRALSGHFYAQLAAGRPIGAALDAAREQLYADPERGKRQRASGTIDRKLQDWFVPALYQAGADGGLLTPSTALSEPTPLAGHNLRDAQESGFHGRTRELRDVERWFVGGTRRIVISGFGGQGKTALAIETGRWLLRTGLFERVCFVSFAGFQGTDPLQLAVTTLATVLQANLLDAKAARDALKLTSTLLILDNLEALAPEAQTELLTEASAWSAQGRSRVLITTRPDDVKHPDYPAEGSNICRHLKLGGLAPPDAILWFEALLGLPPEPAVPIPPSDVVREVFAQVRFHPLSINVLTTVLKQRRIADVAEALGAHLAKNDDALLASLTLSLERLDAEAKAALPGLGVFIDAGLEPIVRRVLALGEPSWARLRDGLRQAGLVVMEAIPGVVAQFVRFHPTLAPAMRMGLSADELARLDERYQREYYWLSESLYEQDSIQPEAMRGIAWRELPNLVAAVSAELRQASDTTTDFAHNVGRFLRFFGRMRDPAALETRAEAAAGDRWPDGGHLMEINRGDQLFEQGQFAAAAAVFTAVLGHLGDAPSLNRAQTLVRPARCHRSQKLLYLAETELHQARQQSANLQMFYAARQLTATIEAELGNLLLDQGDLDGAQAKYQAALVIDQDNRDDRRVAVSNSRLGRLYLRQRDFPRAVQTFRDVIAAFECLREPASIAVAYTRLGIALDGVGDFIGAETSFRESAHIHEGLNDFEGAADSWMNLAVTLQRQNRPICDVEPWYRKVLAVYDNNLDSSSVTLANLAQLLRGDPARIAEARDLAEQALAIAQTLDLNAAEIWLTYSVLAQIATQQGDADAARGFRAHARQSYAAAPIAREHLRSFRTLIVDVLAALREPTQRPALAAGLRRIAALGRGNLVVALRALLDGSRDEDALTDPLGYEDGLIITTIFRCLSDPDQEKALLSENP